MSEPTTDEKIEQLVRSVLEAVDARLDAVRHDVANFAADLEQRHHRMLATVASLDDRLTALGHQAGEVAELRRELAELASRVAVFDSAPTRSPAPAAAAEVPAAAPALAGDPVEVAPVLLPPRADTTGELHIGQEGFDRISSPLVTTHITTQVPLVPSPEHAPLEHMPVTVPPTVPPTFSSPVADPGPSAEGQPIEEQIDLEHLTSLLTERLGHLSLPVHPD